MLSDDYSELPKQSNRARKTIVAVFWLVLIGALVFTFVRSKQAGNERVQQDTAVLWDEQLLACNNVMNAEPTDDFSTCMKMAQDGWIDAALRIAWAYTRDGDYQSWQEVYEWLVWLSDYNEYAELLSHIVVFEIGDSKELKLKGEHGIRDMAISNQPAASAYLASLYYLGLNTLDQRSNILWLLNRAYEKSKYWVTPEIIAQIYIEGFVDERNPEKAKALLVDATSSNFPLHANNVAWFFATSEDIEVTDFPKALELAQKVVQEESYATNYVYVDTLAAAYAANGKFEEAVATQQEAIDLMIQEYQDEASPSQEIDNFQARLDLFKSGQRYTESVAKSDGETFFTRYKKDLEQALISNLYVELSAPQAYTTP